MLNINFWNASVFLSPFMPFRKLKISYCPELSLCKCYNVGFTEYLNSFYFSVTTNTLLGDLREGRRDVERSIFHKKSELLHFQDNNFQFFFFWGSFQLKSFHFFKSTVKCHFTSLLSHIFFKNWKGLGFFSEQTWWISMMSVL